MKVSSKISCQDCPLKCDLSVAIKQSGLPISEARAIHANFKRHEKICKQGSAVTHAIYLVSGTAKLYIEGINDRNIILYLMKPPAYIGLLSFFESVHYSYSVMAIEDSMACLVELDFVKELYLGDHDFLLKLNQAFGRSVSMIMKKIITLHQKNIRGRVAESLIYLSEFYGGPKFTLPITRKDLGMLSGISEENTVRLLTELRAENIIRLEGKELEILDMRLLSKLSDLG
ncbi:MAG: Crp/Fnr family transcriptional regulator [Bacteroidia bacterium]|nr:Crp/Fnr family transcriptional regulator [Bacteroidia bacterium]